MSEHLIEMAVASGLELDTWQRDFLRRLPSEGPVKLDVTQALRNDRRRYREMLALVEAAFGPDGPMPSR